MRKRLISSIAVGAFVLAASGSGFAADMAVKAPPPAPAPVYNWTRWYAGVNVGASFGHVKTDFNAAPVALVVTGMGSSGFGTIPGFAGSNTEYLDGFMGGGQIGYNWQFSPIWVVGFEADFQGAIEKDSNTLTSNFIGATTGGLAGLMTASTVLDYQTKINWFGTVRGRIGYVWENGEVLTYVTGGLAYGRVDLEGTRIVSGALEVTLPFSITQAIDHSQVNAGWVVGGGTEGRLDFWGLRNWTWKIEGLYMDLGTLDATGSSVSSTTTVPGPFTIALTAGPVTTHSHFTDSIVRVGLNYQFH